jgi:hypothetical protein
VRRRLWLYRLGPPDAGDALTGAHEYVLHFPAGGLLPNKAFWSITMGDAGNHFVANPLNRYSVSDRTGLALNPDTSVDVYLGPEPPVGKESHWLQTIPGKGWWTCVRLYSPLEPWFDHTWRPGEIERVD